MSLDDSIVVTYGSCIDLDFDFLDADGNPEDISLDEFGILSASSSIFQEVVFTKSDPENGRLHMFLSAEDARKLNIGSGNWFRLRRTMPGGCDDNTTSIYVSVK